MKYKTLLLSLSLLAVSLGVTTLHAQEQETVAFQQLSEQSRQTDSESKIIPLSTDELQALLSFSPFGQSANPKLDFALRDAVSAQDAYQVETLLSEGANPNVFPALHKALCLEKHQETAKMSRLLLIYGADVRRTHLSSAAKNDSAIIYKSLLNSLEDRTLAIALDFYRQPDPATSFDTSLPLTADEQKEFDENPFATQPLIFRAISAIEAITEELGYGFEGDGSNSLCLCFGISKKNGDIIKPLCHKVGARFTESTKLMFCRPNNQGRVMLSFACSTRPNESDFCDNNLYKLLRTLTQDSKF